MDGIGKFNENNRHKPFSGYSEYMDYVFACTNLSLVDYIQNLKEKYATGQGGYKNVLYPDIEIAYELCDTKANNFFLDKNQDEIIVDDDIDDLADLFADEDDEDDEDDELSKLLSDFAGSFEGDEDDDDDDESVNDARKDVKNKNADFLLGFVDDRLAATDVKPGEYPFHDLCVKLKLEHFSIFCLAAAILSSTQTSYGSVFQIVNESGNLVAPTIESAARVYFGRNYSITTAYSEMSVSLEQLLPIMDLRVNNQMPFSTLIAPDKRLIDYLFGKNPFRLDENYNRFIKMLTDDKELDPVMTNGHIQEALYISYDKGVRIIQLFGDEGSGRRFFVKHFCKKYDMKAVTINCKKLFVYDMSYVDKALWAVRRECIFTNSCCCLTDLEYRQDEKERIYGYIDMAIGKLMEFDIPTFTISREKLTLKDVTNIEFVELELLTPSNQEREDCWKHYSKEYALDKDVEISEMATKFLFTPGKIKSALYQARSYATMNKEILISRARLFEGCNNQMSSELTQKATKVKANFGFEDIVMNATQRETLEHAIEQMTFRKQVYDNWNYTKKYPYGRGLSVLLFGAPGTGKSMCAQVIAHELNLELYRVDLSKVIDKYVGETEKSISMIFREAKKCNVVLFFDECDTLFAKRSDDGGSNQASNNNKTALLLQEVEAYDGVSVLATNYKHNIDPAFFRRMKYIVEFQFPDPDTREMLWKTTIPKGTPLGEDVDIRFLAERFEFVGGNIKNCILNAAFLAAADGVGDKVCMRHYLNAIKYEFVKTGKVFTKADFGPYAYMVGLGEEPDIDDLPF